MVNRKRPQKTQAGDLEIIRRLDLPAQLERFKSMTVCVGIAADSDKNTRKGQGIPNYVLGWAHEKGTETIPARPFLRPGIAAQGRMISKRLGIAIREALNGDLKRGESILEGLALTLPSKVRDYMRDSGHFVPLKPETIRNRHRGRGTKRHPSEDPSRPGVSTSNVQPLIDTAQLMRAIDGFVDKGGGGRKNGKS